MHVLYYIKTVIIKNVLYLCVSRNHLFEYLRKVIWTLWFMGRQHQGIMREGFLEVLEVAQEVDGHPAPNRQSVVTPSR